MFGAETDKRPAGWQASGLSSRPHAYDGCTNRPPPLPLDQEKSKQPDQRTVCICPILSQTDLRKCSLRREMSQASLQREFKSQLSPGRKAVCSAARAWGRDAGAKGRHSLQRSAVRTPSPRREEAALLDAEQQLLILRGRQRDRDAGAETNMRPRLGRDVWSGEAS